MKADLGVDDSGKRKYNVRVESNVLASACALVHYPNRTTRIDRVFEEPALGRPLVLDDDRRWIVKHVRRSQRPNQTGRFAFEVWVV